MEKDKTEAEGVNYFFNDAKITAKLVSIKTLDKTLI